MHLTVRGYSNWADRLWEGGQDRHQTMLRQRLHPEGTKKGARKYFWRGFMSENGTERVHTKPTFAGRGHGRKFHPYMRK